MMRSKLIIGIVLVLCVLATWLFGRLYRELLYVYEQTGTLTDSEYSWVFRLLLNLVGYSTVLLPCYVLYKYLEKTNYFDKISNNSWISRILFACFSEHDHIPESLKPVKVEENPKHEGLELAFCFSGLMGAYLVWGLLQEKIMTQNYVMPDGSHQKFNDSQFLVFINRLLGFLIALVRLLSTGQQVIAAPLYKFSYCSLTNIISAWCQYEALKYVSFPTQVLSKSCKVIPVMLMGKLISRNKYEGYEYGTAVLISAGMALFLLGGARGAWAAPSAAGAALLALYMCCDSFTSSWQGALFRRHALRPLQMLCAVNLCSCALSAAALLHRAPPAAALLHHPMFVSDCLLLSASSAVGQLLIYRTIARFGPVLFTIIMTLRQAVSILISCAVYGHSISAEGCVGVVLVFAAVFLRIYWRKRKPAAIK
ncbi:adenosine 3'-phospho 5'-phosphosulfate transporter 1 [Vanessa tameamea]|uniref:Adenosine 3'-phospho 5'-phosphosulfate transporter 1 n=1 Tax=Vanessa tameamea TaxID=334116 RepID=A0ABM4AS34_VANTA